MAGRYGLRADLSTSRTGPEASQRPLASRYFLLRQLLIRSRGSIAAPGDQAGFGLPLAIVVTVVLVVGVAALGSFTSQGLFSGLFQGVNREARDVAESAITDFGVTMNREENRLALIAGNGDDWTDIKNRNPCTASTKQADGTWSSVPSDPDAALKASTAFSGTDFVPSETWRDLKSGDKTRQFKVTKVEYFYESADGTRKSYSRDTENDNFPGEAPVKTVRDSALEGGTRTLLRVTVVGTVVRNGQTSYARVSREFEVVPKCCKRSFGNNIGAIAWGRDTGDCPVTQGSGVGNGLIGSLNGGKPTSSDNTLDIRDESNKLITQAKCWSGNDPAISSDLSGTANPKCIDGSQGLGSAKESKSGVSFVPTQFSLKLPDPKFDVGGRLASKDSSAAYGTWYMDGTNYWMKLFDDAWTSFGSTLTMKPWSYSTSYARKSISPCTGGNRIQVASTGHGLSKANNLYLYVLSGGLASGGTYNVHTCPDPTAADVFNINDTSNNSGQLLWMTGSPSPIVPRSFGGCTTSDTDLSKCRWEPNRTANRPYPQVLQGDLTPVGISRASIGSATTTLDSDYSSGAVIYLDRNTLAMMVSVGGGTPKPMNNCVVTKDPSAPYAVADCRFTAMKGGKDVFVDTSYAMINFYFDNSSYSGEYMAGSGNTRFVRVHCSRSSWTPDCYKTAGAEVSWTEFQAKCDPNETLKDPNCTVANRKFDQSELWNVFSMGTGSFVFNGGSGSAGANIYAPKASISLKGGGKPEVVDFMGRMWTDNITLTGNVVLRIPTTQASFCNTACPGDSAVPLYDVVGRSYTHASAF